MITKRNYPLLPSLAIALSFFMLLSCSTPASTPTTAPSPGTVKRMPSPMPVTLLPDEIKEIVQVGDYKMPIHCLGQGQPTIILENGDGFTPWNESSLMRFSDLGRVCFYRRVGYLNDLPDMRTVRDQIHDLHTLLSIVGEQGPYVFVGVSRAGLHLLLYTQEYPDEVAGLVFLECQPPTYYSLLRERLGQESPDDPDWVKEFRSGITVGWEDWAQSREKIDILASTDQAMEVTSLGDRPVAVLVAGEELEWEDDWEKIFADSWLESQTALSQLSENSRLEIVPDVSHMTIIFSSAVDKAVEEVYLAAKQR